MFLSCATPSCKRKLPASSTTGLCHGCVKHWKRWGVPVAGFIPSHDLRAIAAEFMQEVNPTQADIANALRIMRGTRHREGPWSERPAYRLQPLLKGRLHQRLPHLLLGRRKAPSLIGLSTALVHYQLANTMIGTRGTYSQYLAGASFFGRRGVIATKGQDVFKGDAKSAGYRLHLTDYSAIGRECLRAGGVLGFNPKARWFADRITSMFIEGLQSARYRSPLVVPYGTFRTTASGDHPLDTRFSTKAPVPSVYHNEIRRSSGLINGKWPDGIDLSWEELEAERLRPAPSLFAVQTTKTALDTSWVFNA